MTVLPHLPRDHRSPIASPVRIVDAIEIESTHCSEIDCLPMEDGVVGTVQVMTF